MVLINELRMGTSIDEVIVLFEFRKDVAGTGIAGYFLRHFDCHSWQKRGFDQKVTFLFVGVSKNFSGKIIEHIFMWEFIFD